VFGNDWMDMFGKIMSGDFNFEKLIDDYMKQAELGILTGLRGRIDNKIKSRQVNKDNPYIVLGLKQDCTEEELKAAYREKVKECHPDVGGDPEQFKKVQASYEAIKRLRGWK
jgi:DnaJ-class molecular chaperone